MSIPLLLVPRFCIDQPHEDNDMFAKEYVDIVLKQSLDIFPGVLYRSTPLGS